MLVRSLLAALLVTSLALAPTEAEAQLRCNRVESQQEEALALFVAGLDAVEALRWSDAVERLEQAYVISCQYAALYNLGIALRALGRHREARDAFEHLLAEHPDMPEEMRANAQTYRSEESGRVATLELLGLEPGLRPELSFDGRPVADDGRRPLEIETDAGTHSLIARLPQHQPFVWEGSLGDGQRESVSIDFEAIVGGDRFDPTGVIIGIVAAVLVAGGVVGGVLGYEATRLQPLYPSRTVPVGGH